MARRYASTWDKLGRENAFGAILTDRGELASWDAARFFETGAADAKRFIADLDRVAPHASRARALDFGCGVGRVTRGLADYCDEVVGVDVAASMIERARALNTTPRCSFRVNDAGDLKQFSDGFFTLVYSRLVLQHIRPALVRRYISEMVRVLASGGVLMFQLPDVVRPTRGLKHVIPWPVVVLWRRAKCRLARAHDAAQMTMYGMAREDVLAVIRQAGGQVLDVRPDASHGAPTAGYEYWVTK